MSNSSRLDSPTPRLRMINRSIPIYQTKTKEIGESDSFVLAHVSCEKLCMPLHSPQLHGMIYTQLQDSHTTVCEPEGDVFFRWRRAPMDWQISHGRLVLGMMVVCEK